MRRFVTVLIATAVMSSATSALNAQPPRRPAHPLIGVFDTNGDGELSTEEMEKAGDKLKSLDTGGDGKLTARDLRGKLRFRTVGPTPSENKTLGKDDAEKLVLKALEQMREGPRYANVSPNDGRLLRLLAETMGAKNIVEIGTSTGDSATWLALGARKTGGKVITHEIDPGRAKIARENFKQAGVDEIITVIEGDAHETVKQHKDPIDILFLDADKEGYIDYLNKLLPLVRPGGLIIAHNMVYPPPYPEYIKAITENPELETSFLLMEGAGIGVTLKKR